MPVSRRRLCACGVLHVLTGHVPAACAGTKPLWGACPDGRALMADNVCGVDCGVEQCCLPPVSKAGVDADCVLWSDTTVLSFKWQAAANLYKGEFKVPAPRAHVTHSVSLTRHRHRSCSSPKGATWP
jgi:hypothetical protein